MIDIEKLIEEASKKYPDTRDIVKILRESNESEEDILVILWEMIEGDPDKDDNYDVIKIENYPEQKIKFFNDEKMRYKIQFNIKQMFYDMESESQHDKWVIDIIGRAIDKFERYFGIFDHEDLAKLDLLKEDYYIQKLIAQSKNGDYPFTKEFLKLILK